jgi:hypothetical protein
MSLYPEPRNAEYNKMFGENQIVNTSDFRQTWDNGDVVKSINKLNVEYKQNIDELKTQIEMLTVLVCELQKINIRVDDKTTLIANEIQQIGPIHQW